MKSRLRTFLILGALATSLLPNRAAPAEEDAGNALALINAYLAQAASTEAAYRADLKTGGYGHGASAGRLSGIGPLLGPFTYRPKTYAELEPAERMALLRERKFRDFLIKALKPAFRKFTLTAGEMLRKQPFPVVFPTR